MRLKVKNYQNAKDVDLLIEGLTVLTGDSNAGKSSVLKALYSATHNRFRQGAVTWGQDSCIVILQFSGESKVLRVERLSEGGSPKVRLGSKEEGYQEFSKLGRDLPTEVQDYNNFGYIQVSGGDKLNLNFCNQFAAPLMVSFSNKKIVEILSYSKAQEDSNSAKKWIDDRALHLKGEISALDSVLGSTKENLYALKKKKEFIDSQAKVLDLEKEVLSREASISALHELKSMLAFHEAIVSLRKVATKGLVKAYSVKVSHEDLSALSTLKSLKEIASASNINHAKLGRIRDNLVKLETNDTAPLLLLKSRLESKLSLLRRKNVCTKALLKVSAVVDTKPYIALRSLLSTNSTIESDLRRAKEARDFRRRIKSPSR